MDGAVCEGDSYVDESMLSGEPLPVHMSPERKSSPERSIRRAASAFGRRRSEPRRCWPRSSAWFRRRRGARLPCKARGQNRRHIRPRDHRHRPAFFRPVAGFRSIGRPDARNPGSCDRTGYRLSVCIGTGYSDGRHGRHRQRDRERNSDQGRRKSGDGRKDRHGSAGQDGYTDRRETRRDRYRLGERGRPGGSRLSQPGKNFRNIRWPMPSCTILQMCRR